MQCRLLDRTLDTLAENLALDEALLLEAEAADSENMLRFWEWPTPAVVLGTSGIVNAEAIVEACERDHVPICRRASGGGTVLLGRGCLLYSLILRMEKEPALRDIHASYRFILGRFENALRPIAAVKQEGISDLAIGGLKISGSAQQRKQRYLLHHGTLLYDFDITLLFRYLRMPVRQPDYRQQRPHTDFVTNLATDRQTLKVLIQSEWKAVSTLETIPMALLQQLVFEKYSREDWNRKR